MSSVSENALLRSASIDRLVTANSGPGRVTGQLGNADRDRAAGLVALNALRSAIRGSPTAEAAAGGGVKVEVFADQASLIDAKATFVVEECSTS